MADLATVPYYHRLGPAPCGGLAFIAHRDDFSFGRARGSMTFYAADGVTPIDGATLACASCAATLGGIGNELRAPADAAEVDI